ncbi:MAG TPA: DNA polymerase III subunit gamma/tau C-terminal domain-containing protein, partial [Pseudomonadales bacterium]
YRDLQFAPDPRAGLEMTLLRMLAFAPDDEQANRVPRAEPAAKSAVGTASGSAVGAASGSAVGAASGRESGASSESVRGRRPLPQEQAPEQAPEPEQAQEQEPAEAHEPSPAHGDLPVWHELVAGLGLSGVARMIAEHSELLAADERQFRLRLDRAHDTLLSDGPVAAIERALAERGWRVQVRVEVGDVAGETPAQRRQRLQAQRQRAAEESLATDSTVRSLLQEFGGRIDGVRPVE